MIIEVRDRHAVLDRLQENYDLHLYEIGDLDDVFWPHTRWFLGPGQSIALLYTGSSLPCLLAFEVQGQLSELLSELAERLPDEFYAHISTHLIPTVEEHWQVRKRSEHQKMSLRRDGFAFADESDDVEILTSDDRDELSGFYRSSYPEHWFDPHMLETGFYRGIRLNDELACVAGVHVVSAKYRVAALGNIATAPSARGRGLARRCTGTLCKELFEVVDCIGLNVAKDNTSAIRCYERLGFQMTADYVEMALSKK